MRFKHVLEGYKIFGKSQCFGFRVLHRCPLKRPRKAQSILSHESAQSKHAEVPSRDLLRAAAQEEAAQSEAPGLGRAARVLERMVNQNTAYDIIMDFKVRA